LAIRHHLLIDFKWSPEVTYSPISIEELAFFITDIIQFGEVKNQTYTICNNESYTLN